MPVLFVCAFTVTALGLVAAVQIARSRRHYKDNIQQIAEQLDGKTSFAYQDLCRQRADGGRASKSSSTSSWCEETAAPTIDISTGHVVLVGLFFGIREANENFEICRTSSKNIYQNQRRSKLSGMESKTITTRNEPSRKPKKTLPRTAQFFHVSSSKQSENRSKVHHPLLFLSFYVDVNVFYFIEIEGEEAVDMNRFSRNDASLYSIFSYLQLTTTLLILMERLPRMKTSI